jgi:hypothetical protein
MCICFPPQSSDPSHENNGHRLSPHVIQMSTVAKLYKQRCDIKQDGENGEDAVPFSMVGVLLHLYPSLKDI